MSNVLGEIKSVLIPKEEYERLKSLCARAAKPLEVWMPTLGTPSDKILITELREASK